MSIDLPNGQTLNYHCETISQVWDCTLISPLQLKFLLTRRFLVSFVKNDIKKSEV